MSNIKHIYKRPPKGSQLVKVESRFIAYDLPNRIGHQKPTYIVIHEVSLGTGKSPKEYNMERYEKKITEDAKNGSDIGYHYLVGDKKIYQFIEDDVSTKHTGTEFGNYNSIGVERLICEGVNYEYATHNQAKLIATLMLKHNIPLDNVITHKEMQVRYGTDDKKSNPKKCPNRMLAGFRGNVQDFKNEIRRCFLYGWFFTELLDEKQIISIPKLQEITRKTILSKNKKREYGIGLQNFSYENDKVYIKKK